MCLAASNLEKNMTQTAPDLNSGTSNVDPAGPLKINELERPTLQKASICRVS